MHRCRRTYIALLKGQLFNPWWIRWHILFPRKLVPRLALLLFLWFFVLCVCVSACEEYVGSWWLEWRVVVGAGTKFRFSWKSSSALNHGVTSPVPDLRLLNGYRTLKNSSLIYKMAWYCTKPTYIFLCALFTYYWPGLMHCRLAWIHCLGKDQLEFIVLLSIFTMGLHACSNFTSVRDWTKCSTNWNIPIASMLCALNNL